VLVAPKQGTYQLEQQLLNDSNLAGYTRLSILSFESLAHFVFNALGRPRPGLLSEEGRVMVLRALLGQHRTSLNVFRASARLTGFARQLSDVLAEIQRAQLTPEQLRSLALGFKRTEGLSLKLQDLAILLERYQEWLRSHELQDQSVLLAKAAEMVTQSGAGPRIQQLWVDGFAEFTGLELDLLAALLPYCETATITFCLESIPKGKSSWLSHWSTTSRSFEQCRKRFASVPGADVLTVILPRESAATRLAKNPVIKHLESFWESPRPLRDELLEKAGRAVRMVSCPSREAEVITAAREIRAFVRAGGRYREASILVRTLDPYYQLIQRIFSQFEIPFFLDRRESICHHSLAELARSAVRLVAFGWQQQDWFAALKTGFVPAREDEVDLLENEAIARGWEGAAWHRPIQLRDQPRNDQDRLRLESLQGELESIRARIVPPFEKFTLAMAVSNNRPTGPELAAALRQLWSDLAVETRLEDAQATELAGPDPSAGASSHETVWRQMNSWLDNAALAFPGEPLPLRDWVAILDSGLANLTIGIIPPSLDQVLVGAVDRSRTPEVRLALVLGLNEGIFPASPQPGSLLTEADRVELEQRDVILGSDNRRHIGRERYLGYIACTRARERLVLTWAAQSPDGTPLSASPLISTIKQLFPLLQPEAAPGQPDLAQAEHASELVDRLLATCEPDSSTWAADLLSLPALRGLREAFKHLARPESAETLSLELAAQLYGPVLRTSVSRMEQFAACPFQFFVRSGLRAEERRLFELDSREQGTFQHDVLALFHEQLRTEGKSWRDITPSEARDRIKRIGQRLMSSFREGLLEASPTSRFTATLLTESLQDFVETVVEWMRGQYSFDPAGVELPFGQDQAGSTWRLDLGKDHFLELYGRIDRVDICKPKGSNVAKCVVIDYKSNQKEFDPLLVSEGLQLQLLAYLNVVRQWPNPQALFGADLLEPSGVFYVSLRGRYPRGANRNEVLTDPTATRKSAYRHSGRFDKAVLKQLDSRNDAQEGDQFNYRLKKNGDLYQRSREPISAAELISLLDQVADNLRRMGQRIYQGCADVAPYRLASLTACGHCAYQAICRFDPWVDNFRVLKRENRDPREPKASSA